MRKKQTHHVRALVISAHPDDMEIGMGGTVAGLCESGSSVVSVILTDGRRGPNLTGSSPEEIAKVRKTETERAARILGIQETIFFDLPSLDRLKSRIIATRRLIEVLKSYKPKEVFTLHPKLDRHKTHRAAGKVTMNACAGKKIRVWAYEVWGPFPKWDRFEDITVQMERKLKALAEYHSQLAAIPYADGIQGLNRWRAVFADPKQSSPSAEFAEVFLRMR